MKSLKIFALMAMVCVLLAGSANAGIITQTCTIPVTAVGFTQTCTMNQFNQPTAGTLTSVVLALTGVGGNVLPEQTNISGSPITFTNSVATIGLTLTGPDSISVSDTSGACSGTVAGGTTNTGCTTTTFSGLSAANVSEIGRASCRERV